MLAYSNPYHGENFFGFFQQLLFRLYFFISGKGRIEDLVSDEIQILVLTGVAVSCALIGSFLILRRMTMLANSLSHTLLLGIVCLYFFTQSSWVGDQEFFGFLPIQSMLIASVFMGILTTFLTEFLTKTAKLQEDASIGLVFTTLFALGIILATLFTRNAHVGVEIVMGNPDALHFKDLELVYLVAAVNILSFSLFFKEFTITTFDPGLSRALGISPTVFNYILMLQVSLTLVAAFRSVGVLMVLGLITGPPLTARVWTHSLKKFFCLSIFIGILSSVTGVALSRHILSMYGYALSTGGVIVSLLSLFYAGSLLLFTEIFNAKPKKEEKQL